MPDVLEGLELMAKRNMLKYQVGHDIFCQYCGNIMDCKRAVSIDVSKDGKLAASKVMCATCYDKGKEKLHAALATYEVEVIDGRQLFKRQGGAVNA